MNSKSIASQRLGKLGEALAATYLQGRGYQLLNRNFKARYGEIDLIFTYKSTLVFVEVKTRIGREFGLPEEAVTPKKLREVIKTSQYYALLHPRLPATQRIDVVGIELDNTDKVVYFNHLINVTG